MAKSTFHNLPDDKKEIIIAALKEEFEEYPIFQASVASIIKRASISRGSFYQYFNDIEDSFFTILELETKEMHDMFMELMREEGNDLFAALKFYGQEVADEIFKKEKYNLYKNRYLYWTCELDEKWQNFRKGNFKDHSGHHSMVDNEDSTGREMMNFLSAVIKKLIENLFTENWDKEKFIKNYQLYMYWLEYGIGKKTS